LARIQLLIENPLAYLLLTSAELLHGGRNKWRPIIGWFGLSV
jgi:hypothetical protein